MKKSEKVGKKVGKKVKRTTAKKVETKSTVKVEEKDTTVVEAVKESKPLKKEIKKEEIKKEDVKDIKSDEKLTLEEEYKRREKDYPTLHANNIGLTLNRLKNLR